MRALESLGRFDSRTRAARSALSPRYLAYRPGILSSTKELHRVRRSSRMARAREAPFTARRKPGRFQAGLASFGRGGATSATGRPWRTMVMTVPRSTSSSRVDAFLRNSLKFTSLIPTPCIMGGAPRRLTPTYEVYTNVHRCSRRGDQERLLQARVRLDTPQEVLYYEYGAILYYAPRYVPRKRWT